ncbi:RNA-guided endonuclease InsQ/TnpB family protein [Plantactinospora alkalitolerans]|uniref:RNA-guided endonuclease InsQ/TnpB family protein n=1 Tax=Plantactinospora alkalitolerans TaxID=2789879 RepID=UPI001E3AA121|nr:transposase [Plantactinospora alkalitolerans]
MLTGRRYLLAFSDAQVAYAEQVGAACRAVWNTALEQRREYRRRHAWINYVDQARQLAEAKRDPDCAWLAEVPSHTLQQTLRDLDKVCRAHGTWKVRWRSKSRTTPSFRFPDPHQIAVRRVNRRWGEVRLPKFGPVRFRWTRPVGGAIRNATMLRDGGRWYVSFCVEDGVAEAAPNGRPPVGVDRGVAVAVATSDGDLYDQQFATPGELRRIRRLNQRLARSLRVHGRNRRSGRRDAVRAELSRLNARIRSRRNDFATQTAVRLVRSHGLVAVEDLRIKNMTASAKGTAEQPGRNVRQKAGLNRAILNKGWGGFLLKLDYAARYHGATVVKINPAYTSQTCNACGHIARDNRESQAVFRCVACGHRAHADVNAAKNILAAGLVVTGRGDLAVGRSVKRQPTKRFGQQHARTSGIPSLQVRVEVNSPCDNLCQAGTADVEKNR